MEQFPVPRNLDDVQDLVTRLYAPAHPSTISQIQEMLQKLQKSAEGWQIAEGLLARPGDNVKFFGALTVMVKLNTESMEDHDAQSLLGRLMDWLVQSLGNGAGPVVIRKLCSALVAHFMHFSHIWPLAILSLVRCLQLGGGNGLQAGQGSLAQILPTLTGPKLVAVLWFATTLAEEAEKTDSRSTKNIRLREHVLDNAEDLGLLLAHSLSSHDDGQRLAQAVGCLQAWMVYSQRNAHERWTINLRPLFQPAVLCLAVDDMYQPTMELLTDTLTNWPGFLTAAHYELLYSLLESDWVSGRYETLLRGDFDFDSVQFGLFLLAFAEAQVQDLMKPATERHGRLLAGLVGLLNAEGCPVAEDKIFVPALEFWSQFVEDLVDGRYHAAPGSWSWDQAPLTHIMQAVSYSWRKIQYPQPAVYDVWESTEKSGFGEARKDVADFLTFVYMMSGKALVSLFVDLSLQALASATWYELEAAAFCLASLSECMPDTDAHDDVVGRIFGSALFELLRQGDAVPVRARQTCLSLVERYSEYFTRHADFLPVALNLLFSAVADRGLAVASSKSIQRLCSSCRSLLVPEVDAFLETYGSLRSRNIDSLAEEKVAGAIASIIQSVPEKARRYDAFRRLLILIGQDLERSLELACYDADVAIDPTNSLALRAFDDDARPRAAPASSIVAANLALRALRCLLAVARGSQTPSDLPIDLESDTISLQTADPELAQIQREIMSTLVRVKACFLDKIEAGVIICHIVKAGLLETEPGPFVFPPDMITDFLVADWSHTAARAVSTATMFISSLSNGGGRAFLPQVVSRLLPWVIGLLQRLGDAADDPDLATHGIEFAQKAMVKCPDVLMQMQPSSSLEFVFMFAIQLLNGSDPLPQYAAADFWTSFIVLQEGDRQTRAVVSDAIAHLGPIIGQSLMNNVGGNAPRSSLERLSEPLKKLVVHNTDAESWLAGALSDVSFPSDKVSARDKALFLKKIISLRGRRATVQVVRDFWLACRGSAFGYAS